MSEDWYYYGNRKGADWSISTTEMLVGIGMFAVVVSILGGFLMEKGPLRVLLQPAEFLIIVGAAAGAILIANPISTIMELANSLIGTTKRGKYSQAFYLENLKMLNDFFMQGRKNGLPKLEEDIENPPKSAIFRKYPNFLKDKAALSFICDTMRLFISGGSDCYDLLNLMELDVELCAHRSAEPAKSLASIGDALPGLGIVAAVLGIVITMRALGGPPDQIGQKVAASLVGTFLGILLCYGFVSPLSANVTKRNRAEAQYFDLLRVSMSAFFNGCSPITAVEYGRRCIPSQLRPTFKEMEKACRGDKPQSAPRTRANEVVG